MMPSRLTTAFFERPPEAVAIDLVGMTLSSRGTAGVIVETEAYHESEPSCHAHRGQTQRTAPLFGHAGTAYVYFTYGMHWCFNVVTGPEGVGAAVLVRAVIPTLGATDMLERRSRPGGKPLRDTDLCSGPAKLVQAMGILAADNMKSLLTAGAGAVSLTCDEAALEAVGVGGQRIVSGPRIGISQATELPWRFGVQGNRYLSRPFPPGNTTDTGMVVGGADR